MEAVLALGREALELLSEKFREVEKSKQEEGLTLREFVQAAKDTIESVCELREKEEEEKRWLLESLLQLFEEIDIDGDGTLTWEEFSEHCVETSVSVTKGVDDLISPLLFWELRDWKSRLVKLPIALKWIRFTNECGILAVCEERTRHVKLLGPRCELLYDFDTGEDHHVIPLAIGASDGHVTLSEGKKRSERLMKKEKKRIQSLMKANNGLQRSITSVAFCPSQAFGNGSNPRIRQVGTLVTTSTNNCVKFWELMQGAAFSTCRIRLVERVTTRFPQSCCYWSSVFRVLFTSNGGRGSISVWEVENDADYNSNRVCGVLEGHSDRVTCFLDVPSQSLTLSGSVDGKILLWSLNKVSTRFIENTRTSISLRSTTTRSSFSRDEGQAKVGSRETKVLGRVLHVFQGHKFGVCGLELVCEESILISVGFEQEIYCWCMRGRMLLNRLSGHRSPLLCAIQLPREAAPKRNGKWSGDSWKHMTQQAVTVDKSGRFRVWSFSYDACASGKVNCIQEVVPWGNLNPRAAAYIPVGVRPGLLVADTALHFFGASTEQHDDSSSLGSRLPVQRQQDEVEEELPSPVGGFFNSATGTFVAGLGTCVWVWNASTGATERIMKHIVDSDISSLCVDERGKKMIVGTQKGDLRLFNFSNGSLLRSSTWHKKDISALRYIQEDGCLVSVSWDKSLQVHCEVPVASPVTGIISGYNLESIRQVNHAHRKEITCVAVSRNLGLIVTGSVDSTVLVWDFSTFSYEGACLNHQEEICALEFLPGDRPGLVSADASGVVIVWSVRPKKDKYERPLARFETKSPLNDIKTLLLESTVFSKARPLLSSGVYILLVTGGEDGMLSCLDLGPVVDSQNLRPVETKRLAIYRSNYNPRRKQRVDGSVNEKVRPKTAQGCGKTLSSFNKSKSFREVSTQSSASSMIRRETNHALSGEPLQSVSLLAQWFIERKLAIKELHHVPGTEIFAVTSFGGSVWLYHLDGRKVGALACTFASALEPPRDWSFSMEMLRTHDAAQVKAKVNLLDELLREVKLSEQEEQRLQRRTEIKLAAKQFYHQSQQNRSNTLTRAQLEKDRRRGSVLTQLVNEETLPVSPTSRCKIVENPNVWTILETEESDERESEEFLDANEKKKEKKKKKKKKRMKKKGLKPPPPLPERSKASPFLKAQLKLRHGRIRPSSAQVTRRRPASAQPLAFRHSTTVQPNSHHHHDSHAPSILN